MGETLDAGTRLLIASEQRSSNVDLQQVAGSVKAGWFDGVFWFQVSYGGWRSLHWLDDDLAGGILGLTASATTHGGLWARVGESHRRPENERFS